MNTDTAHIGCVAPATKILGDKWTPQLVRWFLNNETLRFCQIEDLIPGINPRTLSARLTMMEENGIIAKVPHPDTSRCDYEITQKGRALEPIVREMCDWSHTYARNNN